MNAKHSWLLGVATGACMAALVSALLMAAPHGGSLRAWDPHQVALAWWIATPLTAGLAVSRASWFRHAPAAVAWAATCALPWVLVLRLAILGDLPSDTGEWGGIFARAAAIGTVGGMAVWWALRHGPYRAADAGAPGESVRRVFVVTARAEIAAALQPVLAKRFGEVRVFASACWHDEPGFVPDLVIWDLALSAPGELSCLGAISTAVPKPHVLLVDLRGGAGVRVAPIRVPTNLTRLSYDVEAYRARWSGLETLR